MLLRKMDNNDQDKRNPTTINASTSSSSFSSSDANNNTMLLSDFYQNVSKFLYEKTKEFESFGISFSSDFFDNISKNQFQRYNELVKESSTYIDQTLNKSINSKKIKLSMDSEISNSISHTYKYLALPDDQWELLGEEDNIKIWRCKSPIVNTNGHHSKKFSQLASKWPCIKSTTILDASPKAIKNLLMDSSKVTLVNKFSAGRTDILHIDENSKIVWNKTRMPYSHKPYDFCTLIHCYKVN